MKYCITGASGFIARHLIKALIEKKEEVIMLPREYLYKLSELERIMEYSKPEFLIHLASYGNMSWQQDSDDMMNANVAALYNLLEATKEVAYKGLVNISTSSVTLPKQTMYSLTKRMGEELASYYAQTYNKPIVSVRPYSIYGEGEDDRRFIPTVFRSCLKGEPMVLAPTAVHDWIYIDEIVDRLVWCAEKAGEMGHKAVPLGTGTSTSNQQVVSLIEELTGKKANVTERVSMREFDTDRWVAPGSAGLVTLKEGLERCYGYYKERYGK